MNRIRVWIFRIFVLLGTGLLLCTWFMPLWSCEVIGAPGTIQIRPWGLEIAINEYFMEFVADAPMPAFFAPAMWTFLGLVVGMLIFSLFAKEKMLNIFGKVKMPLPQFLILFVGIAFVVFVIVMPAVTAIRTGAFYDLHLIGRSYIDTPFHESTNAYAGLLPGYWLTCAVGPYFMALALLRNKIIGKKA